MSRKRTSSLIKNNLNKENYLVTKSEENNLLNELKENNNIKDFINDLNNDKLKILYIYLNDEYYKGNSLIDDNIFDYIKKIYKERFNIDDIGIIEIDKLKNKVELPYFVGSMNKIKNNDKELTKWFNKYLKKDVDNFVLSEKLDGISGLFTIELKNNNLVYKLYTRGNGKEGQDITYIVDYIDNLKDVTKNMEIKDKIVCRGELIIKKENFLKILKNEKLDYKNGRNLTAGLVNSKKLNKKLIKYIDFVAYECIEPIMTPYEQFNFLKENKFEVVNFKLLNIVNLFMNNSYKINLTKNLLTMKKNSNYEIDGIICTHNKLYKRKNENPKYSFAYKDVSTQDGAEIIVLGVEWNITKDKYLQPVVVFEPVEINSVMISKATGINAKFIQDNKINTGSKLFIIRSGDVIPKIEKIIDTGEKNEGSTPKNYKFKWDENKVNYILDDNSDETVRTELELKNLENFVDKMNFKNIKKGVITKLYNYNFKTIKQFFEINKEDLLNIDGIKEKSALNIIESINEKKMNCDIIDLIIASNKFGRGFGEKKLVTIFKELIKINKNYNLEKIVENEIIEKIKIEDLVKIEGIQIKTAEKFIKNFENVIKFIKELKDINITFNYDKIKDKKINKKNIFENKHFVFTGFRSKELEDYINNNGGILQDQINNKTDYLIIKEKKEKKSKKELKAEELKIIIMSLIEFKNKYKLLN